MSKQYILAAVISSLFLPSVAQSLKQEGPTNIATASSKAQSKAQLLHGLESAEDIAPRLAKIKSAISALRGSKATQKSQMASLRLGLTEIEQLDYSLMQLREGFEAVENRLGSAGGSDLTKRNQKAVDRLRAAFKDAIKDLESDDKMGNFEIQDLMSRFNQAQTLGSKVQKKKDDTEAYVISNIG